MSKPEYTYEQKDWDFFPMSLEWPKIERRFTLNTYEIAIQLYIVIYIILYIVIATWYMIYDVKAYMMFNMGSERFWNWDTFF